MTVPPDDGRGSAVGDRDGRARFAAEVAAELLRAAHERELAQLREHIDALTTMHRARLRGRDSWVAAVYTGADVVAERLAQVRAATRSELRCLVRTGGWRPGDELPHRTVAVGTAGPAAGEAVRWLPEVPVTMYLADDRLGVVVRDAATVVVVRAGLLLELLGELFEGFWTRADPEAAHRPADQRDQLSDLLLTGLTDQAIGHHLGVGLRTVERRIAALMADLGAVTRFQAGVQAALRVGVVPDKERARPE